MLVAWELIEELVVKHVVQSVKVVCVVVVFFGADCVLVVPLLMLVSFIAKLEPSSAKGPRVVPCICKATNEKLDMFAASPKV